LKTGLPCPDLNIVKVWVCSWSVQNYSIREHFSCSYTEALEIDGICLQSLSRWDVLRWLRHLLEELIKEFF
jgi:hypothetical protein